MSSPLTFTPSFSYAQEDVGNILKITPIYSDFPDYYDFSELTVTIATELNTINTVVDITTDVMTALTGTVSGSIGDSTLTGLATSFLTVISAGDYISFGDDTDKIYEVESMTTDTEIVLVGPIVSDLVGSSMRKYSKVVYLEATDIGLGSTAQFPDDIYTFLYEFTFGGTTDQNGSYIDKQALSCASGCVVYSLIAGIRAQVSCNECQNDYLDMTTKAFFYFEALKASAYNGSVDHYRTILSGLCDITEASNSCGCS